MKHTNIYMLPGVLARALAANDHKQEGKYSVSELLNPPRLEQLRKRHETKVVKDVSENLWALFGTSVHGVIQRYGQSTDIIEQHMVIDVDGIKVSGTPDHYNIDLRILNDWKVTSIWTYLKGGREEWEQALNIYAYMISKKFNAYPKRLFNQLILRDWSRKDAQFKPGYPKVPFVSLEQKLWEPEITEQFIVERVQLHEAASKTADEELPECTEDDRWQRRPVWAVHRQGMKRAVKLFDEESEAEQMVKGKPALHVMYRPGEAIRCESYCQVKRFCSQYIKSKEKKDGK